MTDLSTKTVELAVHEAQEKEKWKRQNEINLRLEELVEKNTEAINSLNVTIANSKGTLKALGIVSLIIGIIVSLSNISWPR
jgi:flagellar motor component MotA|tara:strand:+ start:104 stop:346 length:243 start_codon:yes stop_codon:yes gene_type:complete